MTHIPIGLLVFLAVLGVAVQMTTGMVVAQSHDPFLRFVCILGAAAGTLMYAGYIGYRRGYQAGSSACSATLDPKAHLADSVAPRD